MSAAAATQLRRWREDPVVFAREVLRVEPDAWQADVLRAFPVRQRIAMKAAKGPGKSAVESWCAWNFLLTRPHPKVVATSITGDNLRDGLWAEMSTWQQRSPLLQKQFTWQAERIVCNAHPETWWMSARTWVKGADAQQQANTLAGIHADYVLFILDESGGIPDGVMAAAEGGLATGVETKILQGGNPTHLSGPLFRACTSERHLWFVVEVTGDPDDPKRSPRIDIEYAREQIAKAAGGRGNPWVMVNILGKFPPAQSNALLGPDEVQAAMRRDIALAEYKYEAKVLGCDVARYGDDRTVIALRQGRVVFAPVILRNLDTMQVAGQVAACIDKHKPDGVFIDQATFGAGVVDRLAQLKYRVLGVDFGGKPVEDGRFRNRRAEMWFGMADWLRAGGALPELPELTAELTMPTYKFDEAGHLQLEKKADIKKRTGVSPDIADSIALTFAAPVAPRDVREALEARAATGRAAADYDPFVLESA